SASASSPRRSIAIRAIPHRSAMCLAQQVDCGRARHARTHRTTPADATHWSLRSMAAETGFSHTTIRRMWAAFGLQPHRSQTFKLSDERCAISSGLYLSPPNRALVLSIDEKNQIQALDREQPVLPMMPGVPERRTHYYPRHGTTSLFAALDVAS